MLSDRIARCFSSPATYDANTLRARILEISATPEEVLPYLVAPEDKPYGRRLIYRNDQLEVLVMNWSPTEPCLPHDHGGSCGWVQLVTGAVEHTVCGRTRSGALTLARRTIERAPGLIYASAGMVHLMRTAEDDVPTVTLHFYSPPISGMRVFDLENGASCIVPDDCGAWWPTREQLTTLPPGSHAESAS
jgi:cysteine dioxygenase